MISVFGMKIPERARQATTTEGISSLALLLGLGLRAILIIRPHGGPVI